MSLVQSIETVMVNSNEKFMLNLWQIFIVNSVDS